MKGAGSNPATCGVESVHGRFKWRGIVHLMQYFFNQGDYMPSEMPDVYGPVPANGVEYFVSIGKQQTTISNEDGVRLLADDKGKAISRFVLNRAKLLNLLTAEQVDAIKHELALD